MPENLDVRRFHEKFGVPTRNAPQALSEDESRWRVKFLREELEEYEAAVEAGDLEKQFDALIDLAYVTHGTALLHGFPWGEGWRRVQAANMAKIAVRNTSREGRHAFDVVKPEGWSPASLADLVAPRREAPLPETVCPRTEGDRCTYPNCGCAVAYTPSDEELESAPPTVIIIEGPDGAGKTTLAEELAVLTGFSGVHFSAPAKGESFDDVCRRHLAEVRRSGESGAIIDRFHLSERVYGPIVRGVDTMRDDFEDLLWRSTIPVVVLCMPPFEEAIANWAERNAERAEMITRRKQYEAVYNAYRDVRTTLPVVRYDYTRDTAADLHNRLRLFSA
jgi:predicted HAD superfamily Cof-like phosphohydrolase/thymidylate kinase